MKKRVLGVLLSAALTLSAMGGAVPMTAMADSMMVVTVGADLSEEERNRILNYFNVAGQSYTTITVTNNDEWAHLGSYMSRDIVGYRTISCALIRPMTSGGIQVKTANLTYVTSNMIASNLATAGVTNCEVLAAAPFQVSGTGALTGALMAYENLSGVTLDESKKQAAAQEFATTYELGQTIGQQEAQQIVNDVKMQVINGTLEEDNSVSYEEITKIVNDVVNNYTTNNTTNNNTTNNTTNITNNTRLTDADIAALQELAVQIAKESYEQGTIDALAQIQKTLEGQTQTQSSAATVVIEQNAAPTVEAPVSADTTQDNTNLSAADQALSQDSLLTNTNENALASTTENGSVITSSTAETTINEENSTNLDTQIEEQQMAAQSTADAENAQAAADSGIPAPTDSASIPAPTDVAVVGGDNGQEQQATDIPAAVDTAQTTDAPEAVDASQTTDTPEAVDVPSEGTDTVDAPADGLTEQQGGNTEDTAGPAEEGQPGSDDQNIDENTVPENVTTITADAIADGTVTFRSCSSTGEGSPASGISPVEVVVPYENLTPVSGALHVMNGSGAEAAYLDITPDESSLKLLTNADSYDVPAGSTKILMVPKDDNDITLQTDFAPVAGETYTYTFSAEFDTADGKLDIQIDNYDPYNTSAVSDKGFSLNGSCMNRSVAEGASGSVLFPSDGSAVFATVTADGQSMATVNVTSSADGSVLGGVTAGSGDVVNIVPIQSGPVTLTITYYSAAPEDGVSVDPAAAVGTAQYTIYFS